MAAGLDLYAAGITLHLAGAVGGLRRTMGPVSPVGFLLPARS